MFSDFYILGFLVAYFTKLMWKLNSPSNSDLFKKKITQNRFFFTILWHIFRGKFESIYVSKRQNIFVIIQITFQNHRQFLRNLTLPKPKSFWSDGGIGININIVVFKKTRVAGDISATQRAKQTHNNRNISLWRVQWCGMMCCCYSILCLAYPKH